MGIIQLCPVGRSPGAVTAPLAHLKHIYDEQQQKEARLPESILPRRLGYPVEAIVLFVPEDIYRGRKGKTAYEAIYNKYGARSPIRSYPEQDRLNVVDIIAGFAERELSDSKLTLYARRVDAENFNDCFRTIAETVLALGRPDDLGKTLWANLTGGTNVLNAALLEVTLLSGLISSLYYIFAGGEDEKRFLQPLSTDYRRFQDNHWQDIPVVKTNFDERYRQLLLTLVESEREWWATDELWKYLRKEQADLFSSMTLELFQKQWLRKMGRELELEFAPGDVAGRVQLTMAGYEIVARIEEPLFQTLVQRGEAPLIDIQTLRDELEREKL